LQVEADLGLEQNAGKTLFVSSRRALALIRTALLPRSTGAWLAKVTRSTPEPISERDFPYVLDVRRLPDAKEKNPDRSALTAIPGSLVSIRNWLRYMVPWFRIFRACFSEVSGVNCAR